MDHQTLRMFVREVETQCRLALLGYEELESRVHAIFQDSPGPFIQDSLSFMRVQCFLSHAAGVSKLFWPKGDDLSDPRKALDAGSVATVKAREARNYLEHFNERLEKWSQLSIRPEMRDAPLDMVVFPLSEFAGTQKSRIEGFDTTNWLRALDPNEMEFFLRDQRDISKWDTVSLKQLAAGLRTIHERATAWLSSHS